MIYAFIRNNEKIFPIEKMCKVLQVGQRSYYQWKSFMNVKLKTNNYSFKTFF